MKMSGLEFKISEMAGRIKALREIVGLPVEKMAEKTGVTTAEYIDCEAGKSDLTFAFLYRCALALGVDVTDIIEGSSPRLAGYTVTRSGGGQKIDQAHGMTYYNMAASFKNRIAEPLYVISSYSEEAQTEDIELTTHEGQECDIVLTGSLKVKVGDHTEILHEGDTIYYDSSTPHGMIAVGGADCIFYAIVLNPAGEPMQNITHGGVREFTPTLGKAVKPHEKRVWEDYCKPVEDENGVLKSISFENEDKFNFAFDIIDRLGTEKPDKLAMLHIDKNKTERRFTFGDMKRASSQTANYFRSLGIKRGDRVMLILKRHYEFWFSMLALHKLGAVAIPATNQLKEHDISYRLTAGGIGAVICTADGDVSYEVEKAEKQCGGERIKVMVGGSRDGWHDFDAEYDSSDKKPE